MNIFIRNQDDGGLYLANTDIWGPILGTLTSLKLGIWCFHKGRWKETCWKSKKETKWEQKSGKCRGVVVVAKKLNIKYAGHLAGWKWIAAVEGPHSGPSMVRREERVGHQLTGGVKYREMWHCLIAGWQKTERDGEK